MNTGIHTMTADDYHADPCDQPSLSASLATLLCTTSPAHAWTAHPRLNPRFERREDDKFDVGKIVHALLLEGQEIAAVVDADDWRTKAARAARDEARAAGLVPVLAKNAAVVTATVTAVREQLASFDADPPLLTDGKPEQTLIWSDGDVSCRARLDWLRDDLAAIDDVKTTVRSANPETWTRSMFGIGADVQARFYQRGVRTVTGREPAFRFVVVETNPPYAVAVVSLSPAAESLADAKVEWALATWKRCLETGSWPGYSTRVAFAEPPSWDEYRWLEREAREAA